jgi:predicted deacylase
MYAQHIITLIKKADMVVDLHSFHTAGKPFAFLDSTGADWVKLAHSTGLDAIVTGWDDLYSPGETEERDTITCARLLGKIGITVECGKHTESASVEVGKEVVVRTLSHYGMCAGLPTLHSKAPGSFRRVNKLVRKEFPGSLVKEWHNLDKVSSGDVIAMYASRAPVFAPFDGYIFLPNPNCKVGDEWFYFVAANSEV